MTSSGRRFVDVSTDEAIHEAKNGFISSTKNILTQARKDMEISSTTGKEPIWHLFKGGAQNALKNLQDIGVRVIDYKNKE